jgi:hypothetical protein
MSYDLSTRTNSDVPQPTTTHEGYDVLDEAHRVDTDATIGEPDNRLDGQVAEPDLESENAHIDETPGDGIAAAEPTAVAEHSQPEQVYQERMPSDVTTSPVTTIWPEDTVNDMRTRWQAAQLRFVDDPAAATGEMQTLVGEAVQALSAALADRQRELDGWSRSGHDTEQLRLAVQRYRDFYELLLGH